MKPAELIEALRVRVLSETGSSQPALQAVAEFDRLCQTGEFRHAWRALETLKSSGEWQPSPESERLLESFWWDIAW